MKPDITELINRGWCINITHLDQPGCMEMTASRGTGTSETYHKITVRGRIDSVVKQVAAMCEIAR